MRAVAPQIISPDASKNHTGNEFSSDPDRRARESPPFLVEDRGIGQFGQGDVEDPVHLGRVGRGGACRPPWPSTGTMSEADTIVITGWSQPTVSPVGVEADLLVRLADAAAAGPPPSSNRPPGKLTSPVRAQAVERRVRTSRASPSSSKSGASTAGVDRCTPAVEPPSSTGA